MHRTTKRLPGFSWLAIATALVVACGGDDDDSAIDISATEAAAPTQSAAATLPAGSTPRASATAARPAAALTFKTGRNDYTLTVDGKKREFIIHVPKSYTPGTATPLVFMFHGTSQDGEKFYNDSGWKEKGEAENIITVFPTALKYFITEENRTPTKWTENQIAKITPPGTVIYDDVVFTKEMLSRIQATWTIDADRIYATGFSNGGAFATTRLLMEMPDVFASFAVGGSGVLTKPEPIAPTEKTPAKSLYIVIGTKDDKLFDNEAAKEAMPVFPTTAEGLMAEPLINFYYSRWFEVLDLSPKYTVEYARPARETLTFSESLSGGPNELRLRVVQGMFHIYPGPSDLKRIGFTNCDLFWDFFEEHPMGK